MKTNPDLKSTFMQYGVAAILGFFGVVIGSWLTYQQTIRSQDNEFRLRFASTIKDATPALSDQKTAAMTYASLYALARSEDKDFKRILMIIGYSTSFSSVKTVLAEFIGADQQMKDIAAEPEMVLVAQSAATVSANTSAIVSSAAQHSSTKAPAAQATPDAGQVALLTAAVPRSSAPAWLYYGTTGTARSTADCANGAQIPAAGTIVTLCSSHYLRDSPTTIGSKVITALGPGTHVKVLGQHTTPLSKDVSAVWLRVEVSAS